MRGAGVGRANGVENGDTETLKWQTANNKLVERVNSCG